MILQVSDVHFFDLWILINGLLFMLVSGMAVEVNQYLMSLLAIQRFFLYFFPETEDYLNFSMGTMRKIIRVTYGFSALPFVAKFYILSKFGSKTSMTFELVYNLFVNIVVLISTLLYIPIVISILKLGHLPSVKLSQPQRYVMWQLVALLIEKSIYIPFLFIFGDIDQGLSQAKICDIFVIPLLMQITYLGCNKRTFESIPAVIKLKKMFHFLRSKFSRSNNEVHPEIGPAPVN